MEDRRLGSEFPTHEKSKVKLIDIVNREFICIMIENLYIYDMGEAVLRGGGTLFFLFISFAIVGSYMYCNSTVLVNLAAST